MYSKNGYYEWLVGKISSTSINPYSKLLKLLFEKEYRYIFEMDSNRAVEGIEQRNIYISDYNESFGDEYYINCSVLEMMVALAEKIEIEIATDDIYGDRTSQWFWSMIQSLGLAPYDDKHFHAQQCIRIIDSMMEHLYLSNGLGGLFITDSPNVDMTKLDLWSQANVFIQGIIN